MTEDIGNNQFGPRSVIGFRKPLPHGTASHLEKLVVRFQRVRQRADSERENDQQNARKLVYYQDDDGMWVIHAKLPPEAGEQVIKALEAVVAPIQAERQRELMKVREEDAEPPLENVSAETWQKEFREFAPAIDADTCKPHWTGETMDYRMAIDGLLRRIPDSTGPG